MSNLPDGFNWVSNPGISKRGRKSCGETYFLHGSGKVESYEIDFCEEDAQLVFDTVGNSLTLLYSDYGGQKGQGAVGIAQGDTHSINCHRKENKNGTVKNQYRLSCTPFGRYFEKMVGLFTRYYFKAEVDDGKVVLIPTGERVRNDKY